MNKKIIFSAVLSMTVFILLTILTVQGRLSGWNTSISAMVQSFETPALTVFLKTITNLGAWFVYIPIALLLLLLPKTRCKIGVPSAIALAVSAILNRLLKLCFAIPRPITHPLISETGYGFPSGHAMNGAAFIIVIVILLMRYRHHKALNVFLATAAPVFLFLIGLSRIYLGVHTLSDVIAGYAAGIFLASMTILCMNITVNA